MDFPSNSHNVTGGKLPQQNSEKNAPKEKEKKDIQKVVSGEVVQKPKSIGRRFKGLFLSGEFKGAMQYIITDVLLPALKNVVVDATTKGVERVVYGEAGMRRKYDPRRPTSMVSYNRPVDRYKTVMLPDQPPYPYTKVARRPEAGDIILVSREEAEMVLERLGDIIDKYDVASVADLHDLVGLPTTHVDNKWGWTRLSSVGVRQVREGYLLDLPPVEPI